MAAGRVPFIYPISVAQGDTDTLRQELPEDGSIVRFIAFFPEGTKTDLRLTPVVDSEPIAESEPTDGSDAIPDYLVGSNVTYDFRVSIDVFEGQELGVDAENVSQNSDLDGFAAYVVEYGNDGEVSG